MRERTAVVPMVNSGKVDSYVFMYIGSDRSRSDQNYADYVTRATLDLQLARDPATIEDDLLGYMWILAGASVQIDYWLQGKIDTVGFRYLLKTDQLINRGVLTGRGCSGSIVSSCSSNPGAFYQVEDLPSFAYTLSEEDYGGLWVTGYWSGEITVCTDACVPSYDGPYIPGGTQGGNGEGPNLATGDGVSSPSGGPCGSGGSGHSRNVFPQGGFGGQEGDPDPRQQDAFQAEADAIIAKLPGLNSNALAFLADSPGWRRAAEGALDSYGGNVSCSGDSAEGAITQALNAASIWGCDNAVQQYLGDMVKGQEWIDAQVASLIKVNGESLLGIGLANCQPSISAITCSNCTTAQLTTLKADEARAAEMLNCINFELQGAISDEWYGTETKARFKEIFGSDAKRHMRAVRTILWYIHSVADHGSYVVTQPGQEFCDAGTRAFTYPVLGLASVHLCGANYFNQATTEDRAETLIHEWMHLYYLSADLKYEGESGFSDLGPYLGKLNADSFSTFVQRVCG